MPKHFIWPAVLVTAAVTVAAALLFLLSPPDKEAPVLTLGEPAAPRTATSTSPTVEFDRTPPDHGAWAPASPPSVAPVGISRDEPDEPPAAPWETAINRLLDSEEENGKVAAALFVLLPTLPQEGKLEAVQHMVHLLDNDQYQLATQLLLDPSLHPDLREVVFTDVLDRPHKVQLPILLALLGTPGHPLNGEMRQVLQEVVGSDFGSDPAAWNVAVQTLVAQEAAEEANWKADAEE